MKFKPGQKVLVLGGYEGSMVPQMKEFIGKTVTISSSLGGSLDWPYRIVENSRWVWMEKFFVEDIGANNPNALFQRKKGK